MGVTVNIQSTVSKDRVILGETLPLNAPFTITLDTSERCNLRCTYCFRSWNIKEYGYALKNDLMHFSTLKQAVAQIKAFQPAVKKVSLSGHGEPLCNPYLPEMAKYVKDELHVITEIHTNAILLNESLVERLAAAEIDRLIISVQGLCSQKYQEICKANINFDSFRKQIASLYRKTVKGKIFIKTVDVALKNGEEELFYHCFHDIAHRIFIEKTQDIWKKPQNENTTEFLDENKLGQSLPYQTCCASSFYNLFVAPNGDVYPCIQPLMPLVLGNIHTDTLQHMWQADLRKDFLLQQLKHGRKSIDFCANCNIAQNTVLDERDSINSYVQEILNRF